VLWASHLIDEIHVTDRLIILHKGEIRAQGSVADVLQATEAADLGAAFRALTREPA
jgi:ABC-2 type transport system ATP-binding protein